MKHYIIYTLIFLICGAFSVQGQEKVRKTDSVDYRFALGVQLVGYGYWWSRTVPVQTYTRNIQPLSQIEFIVRC